MGRHGERRATCSAGGGPPAVAPSAPAGNTGGPRLTALRTRLSPSRSAGLPDACSALPPSTRVASTLGAVVVRQRAFDVAEEPAGCRVDGAGRRRALGWGRRGRFHRPNIAVEAFRPFSPVLRIQGVAGLCEAAAACSTSSLAAFTAAVMVASSLAAMASTAAMRNGASCWRLSKRSVNEDDTDQFEVQRGSIRISLLAFVFASVSQAASYYCSAFSSALLAQVCEVRP